MDVQEEGTEQFGSYPNAWGRADGVGRPQDGTRVERSWRTRVAQSATRRGAPEDPIDTVLNAEERALVRSDPFRAFGVLLCVLWVVLVGTVYAVRRADADRERAARVDTRVRSYATIAAEARRASAGQVLALADRWARFETDARDRTAHDARRMAGRADRNAEDGASTVQVARSVAAGAIVRRAWETLQRPELLEPLEIAAEAQTIQRLVQRPGLRDADLPAVDSLGPTMRVALERAALALRELGREGAGIVELREGMQLATALADVLGESGGASFRQAATSLQRRVQQMDPAGLSDAGLPVAGASERRALVEDGGAMRGPEAPGVSGPAGALVAPDAPGANAADGGQMLRAMVAQRVGVALAKRGRMEGAGDGRGVPVGVPIVGVASGGRDGRVLVVNGGGSTAAVLELARGMPRLYEQLAQTGFTAIEVHGTDGVRRIALPGWKDAFGGAASAEETAARRP